MDNKKLQIKSDADGFYHLTLKITFLTKKSNGLKLNLWSRISIAIQGEMNLSKALHSSKIFLRNYLSNMGRKNNIRVDLEIKNPSVSSNQKTLFVSEDGCYVK